MIKSKLSLLALAVLSAVALTATNASAALTYSAGNLLLGFRSGGSETYSYIVNLGQASLFRDATTTFNVSIGGVTTGSLGSDLTNAFGSSWSTRTDLYWGIVGGLVSNATPDKANTVYVSSATATPGGSTSLANSSAPVQSGYRSQIGSRGTSYTTSNTATPNSTGPANTVGLFQTNADVNSWASALGGSGSNTASSNAFNSGFTIEASVGSAANKLDLYRLIPTGTTGVGYTAPGSYDIGTFSINSSGTVNYVSAVPEPSTFMMLGLGAVGAGFIAIRRRQLKS